MGIAGGGAIRRGRRAEVHTPAIDHLCFDGRWRIKTIMHSEGGSKSGKTRKRECVESKDPPGLVLVSESADNVLPR